MQLFDTHAHLDFDKFTDDFEQVLNRAAEAGVARIVAIGASRGFDSNLRALALARKYEHIFCSLGIHPHDASIVDDEKIQRLRELAISEPRVVAIGETGLDYHYDRSPRDQQRSAFRRFIELGDSLDLPVVVHSREAEEDTIRLLREEGAGRGVLHCFSGSAWLAEQALDLGFYLSFSGIVTFKTAQVVQDVAMQVPLDRLLVETDAPFLAPVPRRGRRNEPAYVRHTLEHIAGLRSLDAAELARISTENGARVFGLPPLKES